MSGVVPGIGKPRSSTSLLLDGLDVGATESSRPSCGPAPRLSLGCTVRVVAGTAKELGIPSSRVGEDVGVPENAPLSSRGIDQLVGDVVGLGSGIASRSPYTFMADGVNVGAKEDSRLLDSSIELLAGMLGWKFVGIEEAPGERPLEGAAVDPNHPASTPRASSEGFLVEASAGNGA